MKRHCSRREQSSIYQVRFTLDEMQCADIGYTEGIAQATADLLQQLPVVMAVKFFSFQPLQPQL
jgi:hypothetical protein